MTKAPIGSDVTQDLAHDATSLLSVVQQFDSAWQQTASGQPPPDLESAVDQVPESARGALRQLLQQIAQRYLGKHNGDTDSSEQPTATGDDDRSPANAELPLAKAPRTSAPCETILLTDSMSSRTGDGGSLRPRSFWERGDEKAKLRNAELAESMADVEDGDSEFSVDSSLEVRPARTTLPLVPGYEILGVLGRGGMGIVYRARQIGLNRVVALKMILGGSHASEQQFERFRIEAEAVARLQHPQIVQVYDVGEHDGLPFFSLEYVDGKSLDKTIAGKPQVPKYAANMVEQIARGMQHAHERGLVHRDLKPSNILLTSRGQPKITDFGLVKRLEGDSSQTRSGTIMGTPSYMAPEQGRGETNIGPAADVYALGSLLYALLTGKPPFSAPTPFETVLQLLQQDPVAPSRLQPNIPRDLETICLKCLQKDPKKRYESALEVAEDLRRFQFGEPIRARRVGIVERSWRWCRRNPRTAGLSATVAASLIVAAIALSYTAVQSARERNTLRESRQHAEERLARSLAEAKVGNVRRAMDMLAGGSPHLRQAPEMQAVTNKIEQLVQQLETLSSFHSLLDNARYYVLLGGPASLSTARNVCTEWRELVQQVEKKEQRGRFGWPPLDEHHRKLLNEDIFEGYLLAAKAECDAAKASGDAEKIKAATAQAIQWLNDLEAESKSAEQRVLYVHRATYYGMAGDTQASQDDVNRALGIEPTTAIDHFWHGFADFLRGEDAKNRGDGKAAGEHYRLAIDEYARFIRMRPTNPWGYLMTSNCQLALGRTHDAIINLTTSIQLRPDAPFGYNNRAFVLHALGQHQEALDDFTAAVQLDDEYSIAFVGRAEARRSLNQPDYLILNDYKRAIEINPNDARARLSRAGYLFDVVKDYERAGHDFFELLRLEPGNPLHHFRHGLASMKVYDFDVALEDFRRMEELSPGSPEANYFQSIIHLGRLADPEALEQLNEALRIKPDYIDALAARGHLYLRRGEHERALADTNELVRLAANNAGLLIERADVYFAMQRYAEAAADYRLCIQLDPKLLDAYVGLTSALERQGQEEEARQIIDQMVTENPQSATALIRRSEYLRDRGDLAGARADATAASKLDPPSRLAPMILASIDAEQGETENATARADELLVSRTTFDGNLNYAAAGVFSIAAAKTGDDNAQLRSRYQARAMELLEKAVVNGFHDLNYQAHNRMRHDPALAGIRELAEFKALFAARISSDVNE